ncbi:unnamed protein product, partial [Discosporangium mesarthrocarpum]
MLPRLQDKHGVFLLKELVRVWSSHKLVVSWMYRLFMHVDRGLVEHLSLPTLTSCGLGRFQKMVLCPHARRVGRATVALVEREREEE